MYHLLLADTEAARKAVGKPPPIRTAETIASAPANGSGICSWWPAEKNLRATDRSGWIRA